MSESISLYQACDVLGQLWELDSNALFSYAIEDTFTGWQVEGQLLYALVRMLKPKRVLGVGACENSVNHLGLGLLHNQKGHMDCVDAWQGDVQMIDEEVFPYLTIHYQDLSDYISCYCASYDLIFHDALHTAEQTEMVWSKVYLTSGGVFISHDKIHRLVSSTFMQGVYRAIYDPLIISVEPSDCGMALWRNS